MLCPNPYLHSPVCLLQLLTLFSGQPCPLLTCWHGVELHLKQASTNMLSCHWPPVLGFWEGMKHRSNSAEDMYLPGRMTPRTSCPGRDGRC
jgi:hypothetical protein